ncbi:MAG: homoserine O-succinyltransferase [Corynebacteriales bacterium]|nr:homoserine O-succinyltransferase [Mycobacteriales bacterium]
MTLTTASCSRALDGTAHVAINPTYGTGTIPVSVRYRIMGAPGAPLYILAGGTSAGRRASATSDETQSGWWESGVAELDLERHQILSIDWLTAHDIEAPVIATGDQAQAIAGVIAELGEVAHGFIGYSYGGMVALAFAEQQPLDSLVVASAAHRSHPMATALRVIQRRIVALRPGNEGLALARALAVTTYRSSDEFADRFSAKPTVGPTRFSVESYLDAVGERFVAAVSPSRFLALSESADLHNVVPAHINATTTLIAIRQDRLVPLEDMRTLAGAIGGPVRLHEVDGHYGHDTFLKEPARIAALLPL